MILADKIMSLRKQNGWSQEELAEQLNVSRQSVSKWESGTSIPDIEKIIKMSQLFYVSTDYLLKDSKDDIVDLPSPVVSTENIDYSSQDGDSKPISMEFATEFLEDTKDISKKFALAVSTCVMAPALLIILGALSEENVFGITEAIAGGVGITVMFLMIAAAVMIFVMDGMKLSKYEFLEKEQINLLYGVEAVVKRKKETYDPTFRICITTGVVLCIICPIPLLISSFAEVSDMVITLMVPVLLAFVSIACYLFVSSGMIYSSYQKLLQIDEYDPEEKKNMKRFDKVYGAFWCIITAIYLAISFITGRWDMTWIIWPVTGVLFVPFKLICEAIGNKK